MKAKEKNDAITITTVAQQFERAADKAFNAATRVLQHSDNAGMASHRKAVEAQDTADAAYEEARTLLHAAIAGETAALAGLRKKQAEVEMVISTGRNVLDDAVTDRLTGVSQALLLVLGAAEGVYIETWLAKAKQDIRTRHRDFRENCNCGVCAA